MLAKKSTIITKVIIGISIISLCIMPISVSADNSVTLLDWGWVPAHSNKVYDYYRYTDNSTGNNVSVCYNFFGIQCKQGYTYTYQDTVSIKSIKQDGSFLYYSPDIVTTGAGNFTGNTDKALISVSLVETGKYRIKVVFNTDTSGIPASDMYFFVKLNKGTNSNITIGNELISCYYDPGGSGYQQELVDEIAAMKNQDAEYYSNALQVLDNIKTGVDNTNSKLDGMPQKIEDVLNKQANEEKTEANNKGTDVVNQATEALKNTIPYTSLLDAIQPIKQAASYIGTVSVWTLPSITIPKITGVMEETEIMEEKSFDLVSYAEQYIPDTLLSVIRAVNTCGLILFAVYEVIRLVLWVVSSDSEGGGLFK